MRSRSRSGLAILIAGLVLAPVTGAAQSAEIVPDIVYGHKDGMALTFDVLRPTANANGAAVLYMVSGGWFSRYTAPEATATRFEDLLAEGFTVFAVRHGSSPRYVIPEIVADVRQAVRFIRHNADQWGVDPVRLGAFGGSAGGHLALMLGNASDEGDPSASEEFMREGNRIASVVAYFPPVDLRRIARGADGSSDTRFPALNFDRDIAPEYSPIVHVSPDDPPTLLIHGDADDLVNVSNSETIHAAFQEHDVRTEMIIIPGAGHGFRGEDAERANAAMIDWFKQTLADDDP
ncbi:MAG: prolyl oligopeptidase family serine peptidase [Gemmatimonas sp.]|nr:prolyl oligopeptidase family serine peptidase [Gemmatimonas sp.]